MESLLTRLAGAAADLALGATCPGCDRAGAGLCPTCTTSLRGPARPLLPHLPPPGLPPVWCVSDYAGPARAAVLAHKEDGALGLAVPLGRALALAVAAAVAAARAGPGARPAGLVDVRLVPVPSGTAATRRRGHDPVLRTTRCAAAALRRTGVAASVAPVLRRSRRVVDQAGLDRRARRDNLAGALVVPDRWTGLLPARALVVVVDDVCTTGATLAESARALRTAGPVDPLAAVVCGTVLRAAAGHLPGRWRDGIA